GRGGLVQIAVDQDDARLAHAMALAGRSRQSLAEVAFDQRHRLQAAASPRELPLHALPGPSVLTRIKVLVIRAIDTARRRQPAKGVEAEEAHAVQAEPPRSELRLQKGMPLEDPELVVVAGLRDGGVACAAQTPVHDLRQLIARRREP